MCCQPSRKDNNNPTNIWLTRTWLKRRMWIITATICLMSLSCILVSTGIGEFSSSEEVRNDTYFYAPLSGTNSWVWKRALDVISFVYTTPAYCFPVIIFLIFSFIFYHQYELLTQSFIPIMESQDDIKQYVNLFRKRHQQLCKSVGLTDKVFSFYLAILTFSSIYLHDMFYSFPTCDQG